MGFRFKHVCKAIMDARRGIATSEPARQAHHLNGLLPPIQGSLDTEIERAKAALELRSSKLDKYQACCSVFRFSPPFLLLHMHTLAGI